MSDFGIQAARLQTDCKELALEIKSISAKL